MFDNITTLIYNKAEKYSKVFYWFIFLLFLVGYWLYQHQLIVDTYSAFGVGEMTLILLLLIMSLLPISLSRRLNVNLKIYTLIFCPSTLLLSLLANERLTLSTIVLGIIMLSAIVVVYVYRSRINVHQITSNLTIQIVAFILYHITANHSELDHYKHSINKYLTEQKYDKALEVGEKSSEVDSIVFNLRVKAMLQTNQLGSKLFNYPIPYVSKNNSLQPCHISMELCQSEKELKEVLLCNLLLDKNLEKYTELLKTQYTLNSSLPIHFKEAILVYLSQYSNSMNSDFIDASVSENYFDFNVERKKYNNPKESQKQCQSLYGSTYYYYYFFSPNSNKTK